MCLLEITFLEEELEEGRSAAAKLKPFFSLEELRRLFFLSCVLAFFSCQAG